MKKKIQHVKQCFAWLCTEYDDMPETSPFAGIKIPVDVSPKDQRDPFDPDDLTSMFTAPLYQGCNSFRDWKTPGEINLREFGRFWIPLIGLYTGMRLDEICNLHVDQFCCHRGMYFFSLLTREELKNDASVRHVPIHSDLIDIGLPQIVEQRTADVFPEIQAGSTGKKSDNFGKFFARFLKSIDVKREGICFHSFRHTFSVAAEQSNVEYVARERIVGHVLEGQSSRYGQNYVQEAKDMEIMANRHAELQKLKFGDLNLPQRLAGVG